ncbi:hypothetical protein FOPG_17370 [Fusarium oxysporum f. sp. conglutinans race 2 54008]|uniref:Uncharacterized protein n=1 Tax=Fusarium oxysporum f. sp. conglutinans race 2 54008 TaxID=1089457 RepID=X0GSX0_FUSOX|nr:hypothetical protein FOPG_17370 [Fusarium oxysporum f. sp. conglutinans race 2 54008]
MPSTLEAGMEKGDKSRVYTISPDRRFALQSGLTVADGPIVQYGLNGQSEASRRTDWTIRSAATKEDPICFCGEGDGIA